MILSMKWNKPTDLHLAPRPRKQPRQSRSLQLVAAIRGACLRILDNEGADALNTNRIAEVAGVGVASVYQYFPNKDAILACVYDELLERERAAMTRLFHEIDSGNARAALAALIDNGIDSRCRLLALAPDFYRKYHREFQLTPGGIARGEDPDSLRRSMASTGAMFAGFGATLRVGNDISAQFIFTRGIGAIIDRAAEDAPSLLQDPAFRAALHDMVQRFLLQPDAP
jgi:AcrR family transcriptional regulator